MSWLSDSARCAGRASIWAWRDQRIGMRPNPCHIDSSNATNGLSRCPGRIRAMAMGGFVAPWPKKGGRSATSKCSASVGVRNARCSPSPKKIPRCGAPNQAEHRHHVWTWDFILDHTDTGGKFKMLPLLDQYTRQCLTIRVERQITSAQVLEVLEKAMIQYGLPGYIRSDNGSEFIATKVQQWLKDHHSKTIYIDPGSA